VAKRILLADKDEAFGTMMSEAIGTAGDYEVQLVASATAALTSLRQSPFDLFIFDQALDDVPTQNIVRGARLLRPTIVIAVIPLDGDSVPPELAGAGLAGAMHKIFFRMDLDERLAAWLGLPPPMRAAPPVAVAAPAARSTPPPAVVAPPREGPVRPPVRETPAPRPAPTPPARETPAPEAAAAPARPARPAVPELQLGYRASEEISYHLRKLANEVSADAVLFTYGGQLVASAGMLQRVRIVELAASLDETWHAMNRLAVLAGDQEGVAQALFEGKEHIIYSVTVTAHGAITVATQAGTSPGAIRLRAREAANAIMLLIG
jgi:CheY-like chemotaxis protein/predicted regulator of Ras-like GTPase activity (Roadblock/LC7/MglB family)